MKILTAIVLVAFVACTSHGLASTVTPTPKTTYGSWDSTSAATVSKGATLSVGGWGADTAAKPTPTSGVVAKVFVDGVLVTQVEASSDRPDVTKYYGFSNSGFNGIIDTTHLTLGEHTITLDVGGGPSGWNHYIKPSSAGKNTFTVTEPKPVPPTKPVAPKAKPATTE